LVRSLSFNGSTTANRQLVPVIDFGAVKAGTLVLKATNTGRTLIDGLATSR
jgi:hypothetical protein